MKKGLFISYKHHGYFAKHWAKYLKKRGFDHLILNQVQMQQKNLSILNKVLSSNSYEYLLMTMGYMPFKVDTYRQINIPNKIVFFTDDDLYFFSSSRYFVQYFTWVITTYKSVFPLYKKHGFTNVILSQWACNQELFKPLRIKKTIDVSLIGAPHSNRVQIVKHLINKGIKVKVFGPGWARLTGFKSISGGYLSDENMVKIINQTKINLNPAMAGTMSGLQIKGRTFEIAGCGGFQLTEHNPDLYEYFEKDKELVTFHDLDDLVDKTKYYLQNNNEREVIAHAAYQRVITEHTWERRFEDIFKEIETYTPPQVPKSYISDSRIILIYDSLGAKKLSNITVKSINSQKVPNVIVKIKRGALSTSPIKYKTSFFHNFEDALANLEGDYIAFITDGDYWEPEKLQLQAYSLDYDVKEGIDINISSWGLSIDKPENDDAYYFAQRNALVPYMLIPSTTMVTKRCIESGRSEFIRFLYSGEVTGTLKDSLIKGNYRYIDAGYSLVCLSESKFNQIVKKIPTDILEIIIKDGWQTSGKRLLKKLLFKGRIVNAFRLLHAYKNNKPILSCLLKRI
jgi:hypothetical protein